MRCFSCACLQTDFVEHGMISYALFVCQCFYVENATKNAAFHKNEYICILLFMNNILT